MFTANIWTRWYFVPNVTSSPIPMVNVSSCLNPWCNYLTSVWGFKQCGFSKVVFCLNVFLLRPVMCWLAFQIHWHSGITDFSRPPCLTGFPPKGYGIPPRERLIQGSSPGESFVYRLLTKTAILSFLVS